MRLSVIPLALFIASLTVAAPAPTPVFEPTNSTDPKGKYLDRRHHCKLLKHIKQGELNGTQNEECKVNCGWADSGDLSQPLYDAPLEEAQRFQCERLFERPRWDSFELSSNGYHKCDCFFWKGPDCAGESQFNLSGKDGNPRPKEFKCGKDSKPGQCEVGSYRCWR